MKLTKEHFKGKVINFETKKDEQSERPNVLPLYDYREKEPEDDGKTN